jgi:hypothetical protein
MTYTYFVMSKILGIWSKFKYASSSASPSSSPHEPFAGSRIEIDLDDVEISIVVFTCLWRSF